MLDYHVARKRPVLFIGSAGTGKTAVVRNFLASTSADKIKHTTINFSSQTDSLAL